MNAQYREADVLKFYPFDGDFGEPGDRTFTDKMMDARKAGPCFDCLQEIQPGERIRRMVQLFEGEVKTARWCHKCCEAMALSWTDSGKALEERARIGMTVRDAALALAGGEGE